MAARGILEEFEQPEDWQHDRIKHLKRLLWTYYRSLNFAEEQIALTFPTPPLALLHQREQLNEAIATAKLELTTLGEGPEFVLPVPLTPPTRAELWPTLWFYAGEKLINLIELEDLNWVEPVYLGRSRDCQIVVRQEYAQVSRHHAQLFKVDDGYLLKDNHSKFGTYINDFEIDHEQGKILADADRVVLGTLSQHEGSPTKRACFFIFRKG